MMKLKLIGLVFSSAMLLFAPAAHCGGGEELVEAPVYDELLNRENLNGKIQSWIILNRLPLSWENLNRKTPHN